jgi:HD superfamily phosphodiesterase
VERTAELAVSIGAELGMGWRALDRVEHAALLHDVGRLVLANPAVAAAPHTPSDISAWSAAIIGEAGHLAPIADLVGAMHHPYRRPGERRDPTLAREAHLIRVVASYDEALAAGGSSTEAIEHLHRGAAYDFDPEIVAQLRLILEGDGAL